MKPKVLVIDDDEKLNELLKTYLEDFGFNTITAVNAQDGLKRLKKELPDIIVLDVMLPGMDGFEACKIIRQDFTVPVIMLTARGDVTDRVVGLELGADDYLSKPFEPRELVARIHSVLRRTQQRGDKEDVRRFGRLEIDFTKRTAKLDQKDIDLTTNEFALLALMVKNPGKVLNRDQIMDELKGMDWEAYNRSVDITMSRLRHKLNDNPKNPSFIKTVWGEGYVFIGQQLTP